MKNLTREQLHKRIALKDFIIQITMLLSLVLAGLLFMIGVAKITGML